MSVEIREVLDDLLCAAWPEEVGFSISQILDVIVPWHKARIVELEQENERLRRLVAGT